MSKDLEIISGDIDASEVLARWYEQNRLNNFGAIISFVGVVREEGGISALSFDIYEPILNSWFNEWQKRANELGAKILMAHSKGDVPVHRTSYIAGVLSPQRKVGLKLINDFVEDFKANAPIWKYDVIAGERVYAKERSQMISGAGILA